MVLELLSSRKGRPRMCRACGNLIGANDDECGYCGKKDRVTAGLLADPMRLFGSLGPMKAMVVVDVVVFAAMVVIARLSPKIGEPVRDFLGVPGLFDWRTFVRCGLLDPRLVQAGQYWRLVMPIFLHFGLVHLAMNSLATIQLGPTMADLFGPRKSFVIYVLAGIGGNLVSLAFGVGGAGASGAVFGILGSFLAYAVRSKSRIGDSLKSYVGQSLLYAIPMAFMGVNNYAHAGGFVTGFLVAATLGPGEAVRTTEERIAIGGSWVCLAIVAVSFAFAGIFVAQTWR
jgi:membrane associated rhomboid family serine protease